MNISLIRGEERVEYLFRIVTRSKERSGHHEGNF